MSVKYKLSATVPVAQYANLIPEVEVEAKTIEEAEAVVKPYIEKFFNEYAEKGKKIGAEKRVVSKGRVLEKDIFGNEIFYDDDKHEYTNSLGEVYLSGSKYAESKDENKFNADSQSEGMVARYSLPVSAQDEIRAMWKLNGFVSATYGTALHAAIELYGRYIQLANKVDVDLRTGLRKKLSAKVEKNSALTNIPHLREAVLAYFDDIRSAQDSQYEVLVVDHKNKRAGRIDRLVTEPSGSFLIRDIKSNYKIVKKDRDTYSKQLSFYGDIIKANGGVLGGNPLMLEHFTGGEWKNIPLEKVDTL